MAILTVNAGSSSLKVAVFLPDALEIPLATKEIEGVIEGELSVADAVGQIQTWLMHDVPLDQETVTAIGYRVVHGGTAHTAPEPISTELIESLQSLTQLAPNHMPRTLEAIASFHTAYPNAQHIACFDTGFFADVPATASTLPIPLSLQTGTPLRRYGFHGLAYEGLLASFQKHEGDAAMNGRVIMAHLGSGASVTACHHGKPVAMTMGFTPVSGIMMSTRSGDIEPGVLSYLQQSVGLSVHDIDRIMTHESGLKGVSELSGDMHTLLEHQTSHPQAALAVDLFTEKLVQAIGGYIATLGGVDSIIFSGGIGERSAEIRRRVIEQFQFVGARLDAERNTAHERLISAHDSAVGIHVITSQEHTIIAQKTAQLLNTKESS